MSTTFNSIRGQQYFRRPDSITVPFVFEDKTPTPTLTLLRNKEDLDCYYCRRVLSDLGQIDVEGYMYVISCLRNINLCSPSMCSTL